MRVCKRFVFDAAHFIPGHPGKCGKLHGHRWTVDVELKGPMNMMGMVMDFGDLKAIAQQYIDMLDHSNLNETFPNPTAEHIASALANSLRNKGLTALWSVRVYETPDSYAEWRRDEDGM